jgi:hypothetical protein
MNRPGKISLGVALVLAATGVACADTIQTIYYPAQDGAPTLNLTSCDTGGNASCEETDWANTFAIAQFDTNLGTLNSIDITVMGAANVSGTITAQTSARSNQVSVKQLEIAMDLDFFDPTDNTDSTVLLQPTENFPCINGSNGTSCLSNTNPLKLSNGASFSYNYDAFGTATTGAFDPTTETLSNGETYAQVFENAGGGTLNIDSYATLSVLQETTGGSLTEALSSSAIGEITVTYDYTPDPEVPEPATMALVGAGLLGFGLLAKSYRKR